MKHNNKISKNDHINNNHDYDWLVCKPFAIPPMEEILKFKKYFSKNFLTNLKIDDK